MDKKKDYDFHLTFKRKAGKCGCVSMCCTLSGESLYYVRLIEMS